MPKNHNERFYFLEKYFREIYEKVSELFKIYIKSYNLRLGIKESNYVKNYANELKNLIDKKGI
ncbi:hypothetical protein J4404_01350 [Candidatus Woesearchaeota archaeon]|nr:hypothetical protein [Candidatus Woesearchaeota archaeon]